MHFDRGEIEQGLKAGRAVVDGYRQDGDSLREIQTLRALAWQLQVSGDHEHALELAQEAIDRANVLGDNQAIAHSLAWAGWILGEMGRCGSALLVLDQARRLSDSISYEVGVGLSTQDMGDCYRRLGRYDKAEKALTESMGIARKFQVPIGIVEGGTMLADVRMKQGRYAEARELLVEAQKLVDPRDPMQTAYVEEALGRLEFATKNPGGARDHFQKALDWSRKHKYRRGEAMAMMGLGQVAEDPREAFRLLEQSLAIFAEIHDEHEGWAMSRVGVQLVDMGKLDQGEFVLKQALVLVRDLFQREKVGMVKSEQALIAMLKGETGKEIEKLRGSIAALEQVDNRQELWKLYAQLAEVYEDMDQLPLALEFYRKAFRTLNALPPVDSAKRLQKERDSALWTLAGHLRRLYDQAPQGQPRGPQ